MSTETIALIMTTLGGIAAAVKAVAEARKARYEAAARLAEAERADDAEKTADAVIKGVERAKKTLGEANLAEFLVHEIQDVATSEGVEEKLNMRVKSIKKTGKFSKTELGRRIEDS